MSEHQPNNVSAAGVLLPCPFCGGEAKVETVFDACIVCVCGASGEISETIEGATSAWNGRAAASAQATAPVGWFVQRSSFGPWIEVERYEDGAVRLHRMDGDQATAQAVGESDGDKRAAHCVNTCN